jgi:hypothetical protein
VLRRPRRRARLLVAALVPALLLTALAAWAFSSPVGSSPDDDFHLPSIWCGVGERPGLCEDSGDPATRLVPLAVVTAPCFAYAPTESGACWNPSASGMFEAERVNTAPLYPPVFYAVMGIFASSDVQMSVIAMRLVNSVLAVGLFTAAFWALPRRLRPSLVLSTVGSAVPLGAFVYASTNPSSWALIGAALVWVCVYGTTRTAGRRRWVLAAFALTGVLLGAGARADAAAFTIFGALLALLVGLRRSRGLMIPLVTSAGVAIIGAAFFLSAGQSSSVVSGLPSANLPLTRAQLADNAVNVPSLWTGALGGWGLGWLDTTLPTIVVVFSTIVAAGIVFVGVRRPGWRRGIAVWAALLALWAVPFLLLAQSRAVVGTQVQPRYILPLIVILLGVASAGLDSARIWTTARRTGAALLLTIAFGVSLWVNTRRYTTGVDGTAINPGTGAEWWWPHVPGPLFVIAAGTMAFGGALWLLAICDRRSERRRTEVGPVEVDAQTSMRTAT